MASSSHSKKKVCYYYDPEIAFFEYGKGHPMKPLRLRVTHDLLINYGLYNKMEVLRPRKPTFHEMTQFHSDDYINFLQSISPENKASFTTQIKKFITGEDCPIFDGLYEFCQLSAGGSVAGAAKLNTKAADIAINWSGGLHHAKKASASGFCYVNDIVLAILELLKHHRRVLYIDIDIHHGDGVEEAFYTTNRVMTVSFHKHDGKYFPGSGDLSDIGAQNGKFYSLNCPLRDGIDDDSYESIFVPVISKVMENFRPEAVVLQCGADSLSGDRLGVFNLTVKGHGKCVEFIKKYNLPLMLLGGGGYNIKNVASCWTYETAVAVGSDLSNVLPYNSYYEYFEPDFNLQIRPSNMANQNTPKYLENLKEKLFENLRMLPCAPSVQIQHVPDDLIVLETSEEEGDDDLSSEERISGIASDKRITYDNEYSDSEDEGEGRRFQRFSEENRRMIEAWQCDDNATGADDNDNGQEHNEPVEEYAEQNDVVDNYVELGDCGQFEELKLNYENPIADENVLLEVELEETKENRYESQENGCQQEYRRSGSCTVLGNSTRFNQQQNDTIPENKEERNSLAASNNMETLKKEVYPSFETVMFYLSEYFTWHMFDSPQIKATGINQFKETTKVLTATIDPFTVQLENLGSEKRRFMVTGNPDSITAAFDVVIQSGNQLMASISQQINRWHLIADICVPSMPIITISHLVNTIRTSFNERNGFSINLLVSDQPNSRIENPYAIKASSVRIVGFGWETRQAHLLLRNGIQQAFL